MDVKIENMDTVIGSNGDPQYVSSIKEIAQRVKIACSVKKGSFRYNRKLGCYDCSYDIDDDNIKDKLSMMFKEATIDIPYTDLRVLEIKKTESGNNAVLEIKCADNSASLEVTLHE
ncbi:MAG: hypothetical protein IJO20_05710 [Ruminococcus sp.]|nr:hypothetical protein [Ruminococcus sp.]MBQ7133975.1 hypothetical protein [Ruminococcus sp.]